MDKVKLNKAELLKTLNDNFDAHVCDILESREKRREEVRDNLLMTVSYLDEDVDYQPPEIINFPLPESHESDYKKAIKMVEMSVDDIIELTDRQFDQLVMDNWSWKQDFMMKTMGYLGK